MLRTQPSLLRRFSSLPCWFALFFWGLFGTGVFVYMRHPIHEPDIWWHLATGRFMVENRAFVRSDYFSHALLGTPWINFEWLSQVFFYWFARIGGVDGVCALKVTLGLTAVGLLIVVARVAGARGAWLFLIAWLGYHVLRARLCARIELVTLNFLGIFTLLAVLVESERVKRFYPWLPILFAVLAMVWCNMHAGFIYGLGLLFCFALGARWAGADKRQVAVWDRSFLLSAAATLINPYGIRLYDVFLHVMRDFHLFKPDFLQEWAPPTLTGVPYFWGSFGMALIGSAYLLVRRDRSAAFWFPAVFLFGLYGTRYVRTTALFSFAVVPFLARAISSRRAPSTWLWALCLAPLAVEMPFITARPPQTPIDAAVYPVGACEFVQKNNIDGRMYNPLGFGGYIDWVLGPERKTFVDGRYISYPILVEEQKRQLDPKTCFSETAWKEFLDSYGIDYAIQRYDDIPFKSADEFFRFRPVMSFMFPPNDWALVYWDDASLLFLKRLPKFERLITEKEYRYVLPQSPGRTIFLARQDPAFRRKVFDELTRHATEVGPTMRAQQLAKSLNPAI